MKGDLNEILTFASAIFSALAAVSLGWVAWRTAKRDRSLSKKYKLHVGKLMVQLRREYADKLRSQKSS